MAQMDYLSRQDDLPLRRSEEYMGVEIDAEEAVAMARGWQMPTEGGKADRTSHFVVSFPIGTDPAAAEASGRAWAQEMFGSGNFGGDRFDYYTAFHTDKDHPHIHVIVHRRGMDNGTWLAVSKRSEFNYQTFRDVHVRVAGEHGIDLEATPRLTRGVHERAVPDAEYRRAQAEGRKPVAPSHTEESGIRAAAALVHHARRMEADATALQATDPDFSALLRTASERLAHGMEITPDHHDKTTLTQKDLSPMAERLEQARTTVRDNFTSMDQTVADIPAGADRVRFERQIAELKAEAAPSMPERDALRAFLQPAPDGQYRGMREDNYDARYAEIKGQADRQVEQLAERAGLNGIAMVARYSGEAPSRGLAQQYAASEAQEREMSRSQRGEPEETPSQRNAALAQAHQAIQRIYREANERATGASVGISVAEVGELRDQFRAVDWTHQNSDSSEDYRRGRAQVAAAGEALGKFASRSPDHAAVASAAWDEAAGNATPPAGYVAADKRSLSPEQISAVFKADERQPQADRTPVSVDRSGEVDMTLIRILRDRFTKTDFNYGYSDSPQARAEGQEQVRNAEAAFRSFAAKSPAYAAVASAAWDQATDIYRPPEGYVRPNDRQIPVERTNELLREAAQLDRADRMAQAEREIAARHAQRATDTAEGRTGDAAPTPQQPRAVTAEDKKLADRAERMAEAERDIAARQAKGKDRDSGHGL
ncbi:relaxase/mobilization nuclease domain-containing protein [Haematobacter genomosp. 1]|nr:relaxase/mobilization nuclease domain-containing protein [Haematobacter genomosp. 1]